MFAQLMMMAGGMGGFPGMVPPFVAGGGGEDEEEEEDEWETDEDRSGKEVDQE
jgi:hypothetical protein